MKDKDYISLCPDSDVKLLEYVKSELKQYPSGKVKSFLEHRQIAVDGVITTKYDFPVLKGQVVSVQITGKGAAKSPLEIIYEDKYLLAVNKPAGLLSVASETEKERTVYRLLCNGRPSLFVVHRLDRDTSGVLLFAKTREICTQLQENWGNTKRREYEAVCEGVFEDKKGRITSYLKENENHYVYSSNGKDGKLAITNYEVVRENNEYSYLKINIETGRKNQIRVHMKEQGHPVAGDKKYGAETNPLGRLALHASLLEIEHPEFCKPLVLKCAPGRHFTLPSKQHH